MFQTNNMVNIYFNMLSFLRVVKFALQDIVRNSSLSMMTILVLILMLLSINTVVVIRLLTEEASANIKDRIDVSIYFDHSATDTQIEEVKSFIKSFPEVTDTVFYTREEVLDQFRKTYKDSQEIVGALDELEDNPLGATMVVKTRETSDYQKIITALGVPEYENIIESKTFQDTEKAISRIDMIMVQVERFSVALSIFFAIIAFVIIFNTIRISIYTQRIEISIKKLVGASNWFVRGPYMLVSIIFSVVSAVLTYLIMLLTANFLDPYIEVIIGKADFLTMYFNSKKMLLLGSQCAIVLVLTILSSLIAMRRHLRV